MIHNQPEQQASELEKKQFISISKSAGHDKERLSKLNKPTNKPTNKQKPTNHPIIITVRCGKQYNNLIWIVSGRTLRIASRCQRQLSGTQLLFNTEYEGRRSPHWVM